MELIDIKFKKLKKIEEDCDNIIMHIDKRLKYLEENINNQKTLLDQIKLIENKINNGFINIDDRIKNLEKIIDDLKFNDLINDVIYSNAGKKWSNEDTKYLIDNYNSDMSELIKKLNRKEGGILAKISNLGLKRIESKSVNNSNNSNANNTNNDNDNIKSSDYKWTNKTIKFCIDAYKEFKEIDEISKELNCDTTTIEEMLIILGYASVLEE